MAGPRVIRDMGETLVQLLQAAVPTTIVAAADIHVVTPSEFQDFLPRPVQPAITIFLYRVSVNSMVRNGPRVARPNGATTRPFLPVELNYLITPWAPSARDEHVIVGRILQALYDRCELGPADLAGTSWAAGDSVQLLLESLPTDEHYRIWDAMNMPYRLSLTYLARVLSIEPEEQLMPAPVVRAVFGGGRA